MRHALQKASNLQKLSISLKKLFERYSRRPWKLDQIKIRVDNSSVFMKYRAFTNRMREVKKS